MSAGQCWIGHTSTMPVLIWQYFVGPLNEPFYWIWWFIHNSFVTQSLFNYFTSVVLRYLTILHRYNFEATCGIHGACARACFYIDSAIVMAPETYARARLNRSTLSRACKHTYKQLLLLARALVSALWDFFCFCLRAQCLTRAQNASQVRYTLSLYRWSCCLSEDAAH